MPFSFCKKRSEHHGATRASCPLLVLLFLSFFLLGISASDPLSVVASLKNPATVVRTDATSGRFLGSISVNKAIDVGCDGNTIAVLSESRNIGRYDALTGSFRGSISVGQNVTDIQVIGGVIIVRKGRSLTRYNAKTGAFLGSSFL